MWYFHNFISHFLIIDKKNELHLIIYIISELISTQFLAIATLFLLLTLYSISQSDFVLTIAIFFTVRCVTLSKKPLIMVVNTWNGSNNQLHKYTICCNFPTIQAQPLSTKFSRGEGQPWVVLNPNVPPSIPRDCAAPEPLNGWHNPN